jgi:hypothetical protein
MIFIKLVSECSLFQNCCDAHTGTPSLVRTLFHNIFHDISS